MQKKITFDDIAKYTHFSKTTISRYFNHLAKVNSLVLSSRTSRCITTLKC